MWKIQLRCSLIQECPSSNIFHTILIKICSIITSNLSEWWFKFTYWSLFGWISSKTEKIWVEHKRMTLWGIPVPVTWKIISNFAFSSFCQTRSSEFWKIIFQKASIVDKLSFLLPLICPSSVLWITGNLAEKLPPRMNTNHVRNRGIFQIRYQRGLVLNPTTLERMRRWKMVDLTNVPWWECWSSGKLYLIVLLLLSQDNCSGLLGLRKDTQYALITA